MHILIGRKHTGRLWKMNNTKNQTPNIIVDGVSVSWKLGPIDAGSCPHLENTNWCLRVNKFCCWNVCPIKTGGFEEEKE